MKIIGEPTFTWRRGEIPVAPSSLRGPWMALHLTRMLFPKVLVADEMRHPWMYSAYTRPVCYFPKCWMRQPASQRNRSLVMSILMALVGIGLAPVMHYTSLEGRRHAP
jgi:hypothetical protein